MVQLAPGDPIPIQVVNGGNDPIQGALVKHVTGGTSTTKYARFLSQSVVTDVQGRAEIAPFDGDQALWAEKGELVSPPWQGRRPTRVTLRLGWSFTVGGNLSLPDWSAWDPDYAGERRILISGQTGNLWRPLCNFRDVTEGPWGPLRVALGSFTLYRVRLEGLPILPLEQTFEPPPAGTHKRIDFSAERAADLQLLVLDESGQPITSARVKAWWSSSEAPWGAEVNEGSSRPDGRIHLTSVAPGLVKIRVGAPGFAFFDGEVMAPTSAQITLVEGGRIIGCVTHGGEPVHDFQVIYWQSGTVVTHRSETFLDREDGTFELDHLTPGGWSVLAASPELPGSPAQLVEVSVHADTRVSLEIPAPIRGGGRVVEAATGLPVGNALVQPHSSGASGRSFPWGPPVRAASDGSFDLDAFVLGRNHLSVEAPGFARADVTAMAAEGVEFLDWGDIHLQRPQRLRITLLGREGLQGLAPGDLSANSEEGLAMKRFSSDGIVEYEAVSPGDHQVYVNYPDSSWSRLRLRLDPGRDWDFDFKIAGPRILTVRVFDEGGRPLSARGAVFMSTQEENGVLVGRMKQPWHEGRVRFEGVRARRAQILVMSESNEILASRDVDLPFDEQEIEIQLGETVFRVHVVDQEHAPVASAWLSVRTRRDDHFVGVADTGSDGWASFKGLPADELLLNVAHPILGARYSIPMEASTKELEVVLDARSSLTLTLLDGDVPLAGAATRIETQSGVTLTDARETDASGIVRYELLGAGHYRLSCRRADCWPAFVDEELEGGEQASLSVQMRRLGDLELVFLNREGLRVSGLAVELRSSEFDTDVASWIAEGRVRSTTGMSTDSSGAIRVEGLPRGRYEWSVTMAGTPLAGSVVLAPGPGMPDTVALP
jgi:hypothetical protein